MITTSMGAARLQSVTPMLPAQRPRPANRVLVPVIRGQPAASLLAIGDAIAAHCPAHGVVLSLVEIPSRWSGMVTSAMVRSRELLRWIAAADYAIRDRNRGERLSIHSRFTTEPAATIGEALLETGCDTIVVEFPPINAPRHGRCSFSSRTQPRPQIRKSWTDMLVGQMLSSVIDHLTKTVILTRAASGTRPAA